MIKQAVILAGGFGTRISEESDNIPKPMVIIGKDPIILHIMRIYAKFGVKDFIILAGYKAEYIKNYFLNFHALSADLDISLSTGEVTYMKELGLDWRIRIVDTGLNTMTGGRIKKVRDILDQEFFLTYGDGVADVDLKELYKQHANSNALVTLTRVISPERFGILDLKENKVVSFKEKPNDNGRWINAGFFVVKKDAINYIADNQTNWEQEPLRKIASNGQLNSYKHEGFWQAMDTLRDKRYLDTLLKTGDAPWI